MIHAHRQVLTNRSRQPSAKTLIADWPIHLQYASFWPSTCPPDLPLTPHASAGLATWQHVMTVLDLSATQLQILCGVLTPLSLALPDDGCPHPSSNLPTASSPQQEQPLLSVHELSLFLLAQLFSREAQRPDNVEVWPEAGPSLSPLSVSDNTCSSPTRAAVGRSPSGKPLNMPSTLSQSGCLSTPVVQ